MPLIIEAIIYTKSMPMPRQMKTRTKPWLLNGKIRFVMAKKRQAKAFIGQDF